jgi:integrase
VAGKLIRQSLKTDAISVAKLRLGDLEKAERQGAEAGSRIGKGKLSFGDGLTVYRRRIEANPKLKPRSKDYYYRRITALLKSLPGIESEDVRKITKADCLSWAGRFARTGSATAYNNTVKVFRNVMEIGVEMGARYDNPVNHVDWVKPGKKELTLPSLEQFDRWLAAVVASGTPWAARAADTIQFLAFTGCRLNEAANVTWQDVDFSTGRISVRITKNSETRTVPHDCGCSCAAGTNEGGSP